MINVSPVLHTLPGTVSSVNAVAILRSGAWVNPSAHGILPTKSATAKVDSPELMESVLRLDFMMDNLFQLFFNPFYH